MKKLLLLLLCLTLLAGTVGCGKNPAATSPTDPVDSTTLESSNTNQYVVDPMINQFLLDFEQQKRYVLAGLTQNKDLSCSATIDVCQLTITSTKYGLHFSLTGGTEEAQRDRMLDVFWSIAQVADPSFNDTQAQNAVNFLKEQTDTCVNHKVSAHVTVNTYIPIIQNNSVLVECRMDFTAGNYYAEAQ